MVIRRPNCTLRTTQSVTLKMIWLKIFQKLIRAVHDSIVLQALYHRCTSWSPCAYTTARRKYVPERCASFGIYRSI